MLAAEEHIDQTHSPGSSPRATSSWAARHRLDHHLRAAVLEGRPARQEGDARPHRSGSRTELDGAAAGRDRRRPPRRPRSARRRATSSAERARLLAEADAARRGAAGRRPGPARARGRRARTPRPTPTSPPLASRAATSCAARSAGHRVRRRRARRRADARRRDASSAWSRSSSHDVGRTGVSRGSRTMTRATTHASTATPGACSRSPAPRARSTRSRTSCSASPARTSRATSCASALTDDTDPGRPSRQAIVEDLLGGKATPTTVQLISMVVGSGHGTRPAGDRRPPGASAPPASKDRRWPRSARPSSSPPTSRTACAPRSPTPPARACNLKVIVDPTVLGGLVATVGDTVIDGTVRTRLDQLKSRL